MTIEAIQWIVLAVCTLLVLRHIFIVTSLMHARTSGIKSLKQVLEQNDRSQTTYADIDRIFKPKYNRAALIERADDMTYKFALEMVWAWYGGPAMIVALALAWTTSIELFAVFASAVVALTYTSVKGRHPAFEPEMQIVASSIASEIIRADLEQTTKRLDEIDRSDSELDDTIDQLLTKGTILSTAIKAIDVTIEQLASTHNIDLKEILK